MVQRWQLTLLLIQGKRNPGEDQEKLVMVVHASVRVVNCGLCVVDDGIVEIKAVTAAKVTDARHIPALLNR